ncbi:MAG: hypothetical protein KJ621_06560 [Proteobacteria bacterium]|nr:hypothetical protein [Pseudomonadota bacterium]
MSESWKNRIVGHADVDPRELLANPFNFRVHTEKQGLWTTASLSELGWIDEVKVNRNTGHMVDGHFRVELAIRENQPTVPVTYLDLSEQEEKRALAIFDRITAMAAEDPDLLAKLLEGIDVGADEALAEMLGELKAAVELPEVEFKEFDESVEADVEFIECPQCGHRWPK